MSIKENYNEVKRQVLEACQRAGRDESTVKLLAVTKTHPTEIIEEGLAAGIEYIAENKVQESIDKIPKLKDLYKEFHFIGHLQSNKIRKIIDLEPQLIHSLDSLSTIKRMNRIAKEKGIIQSILIQINTSGEASKFGITPEEADDFIDDCQGFECIRVMGLMTIGKFTDNEQEIRRGFKLLKTIFDRNSGKNFPNIEMKYLSMGMSNDFEIAIEEGANIIRVGSAIFGKRYYQGSEK